MKTSQKTQDNKLGTLIKILNGTSFDEIPQPVQRAAQLVLLDTLGAILLGNRLLYLSELANQCKIPKASPLATVLGHGFHTLPHLAGLINGSGGTAHELDEGHRFSKGHPGIHVISAALATGEHFEISGKALLRSIVLGYEITAKMAMAMQPLKPQFHPHGTWGALGAAYTSGLLLNLSPSQLEQSIQIVGALCMSPSRSAVNEGATLRNLYAGVGVMNGILSSMFVKANINAPKDGFQTYASILSEKRSDMDLLLNDVATYFEITRNYFKIHAYCAHVHSAIDAMGEILHERTFLPRDVDRMVVKTYLEASRLAQKKSLNPISAKFSIPYALAAFILFRDTGHNVFENSKLKKVRASGLLEKISISLDPQYQHLKQELRPAMVRVLLKDGTTLSSFCSLPKGNYDNPYGREDILKKFKSVTSPFFSPKQQQEIIEIVDDLKTVKNIRDLTTLCKYTKFARASNTIVNVINKLT